MTRRVSWCLGWAALIAVAGVGFASSAGAAGHGISVAQLGAPRATAVPGDAGSAVSWGGWLQTSAAYTFGSPAHWSAIRARGELAGSGELWGSARWRMSVRGSVDGAFRADGFFPPAVRHDQRAEVALHEAYVDFSRGNWEFRLGKQNIVWGEMVGLFFADVVSAKDLREYVLPEFNLIRIPQWAARAEWFGDDSHLELIWLPAPAVDLIGKPGAEFYPYPRAFDGYAYVIENERGLSRSLSNGGLGVRVSTLVGGWDLSAFVYRGPDSAPTFYRSVSGGAAPTVSYQARHDRVTRLGGTFAKDFGGLVVKGEVVYASGAHFGLVTLGAGNGLVQLNTVDWVVGLDFTPAADWRVNAQLFQRIFLDHDPGIGLKRHETGASVMLMHTLSHNWDTEILAISSLARRDWMLRAAAIWKAGKASRMRFGVDAFGGDANLGLFGQYGARDRVYAEYRYAF